MGQGGNTLTNVTTAATGDQNDPTTVGDDLTEQVTVTNDANLVTCEDSGQRRCHAVNEGDTVTFQIQVTNNGAAQATNVSLTDLLPTGLTATAGNGTISQGSYNAATGTLVDDRHAELRSLGHVNPRGNRRRRAKRQHAHERDLPQPRATRTIPPRLAMT